MSKHEKESEPKKTEKGFSTALLLNLSPYEGINEGIDNIKLNTSASAAQDSTTKIKDFLSMDLLEKIEAESPLVKLQEKNNNKLNDNILDLGNNDINLENSSLNSSVDDSEDEEFENENNENKIKQNLNPILNEMVKNENNIKENNSNKIKNNYYIPQQQSLNLNNENYSEHTNKNLYSYYGSTSQYLSRHMNNNNLININENDFQINNNNNNFNNSEMFKQINEINNQQKLFYEYQKLQEFQKLRENQEKINQNNNFYQNNFIQNQNFPIQNFNNHTFQNIKKNEQNEIKNNNNKIKLDKNGKPYKEEDYIIEMFGRVGWICEQCNNFNYDTRNKCNRCGIPKSPKKISKMKRKNELKRQEEQEKLKLQNQIKNQKNINSNKIKERKGDWICAKCGNLNFSFRLICNRCQLDKKQNDFIYQRMNIFNNPNLQMGNLNNMNSMNNINPINNMNNQLSQFQFVNNGPFYFNNMNIIQFNNLNQNTNDEEDILKNKNVSY